MKRRLEAKARNKALRHERWVKKKAQWKLQRQQARAEKKRAAQDLKEAKKALAEEQARRLEDPSEDSDDSDESVETELSADELALQKEEEAMERAAEVRGQITRHFFFPQRSANHTISSRTRVSASRRSLPSQAVSSACGVCAGEGGGKGKKKFSAKL